MRVWGDVYGGTGNRLLISFQNWNGCGSFTCVDLSVCVCVCARARVCVAPCRRSICLLARYCDRGNNACFIRRRFSGSCHGEFPFLHNIFVCFYLFIVIFSWKWNICRISIRFLSAHVRKWCRAFTEPLFYWWCYPIGSNSANDGEEEKNDKAQLHPRQCRWDHIDRQLMRIYDDISGPGVATLTV